MLPLETDKNRCSIGSLLWLMDCRAVAERRPELGEHQSSTPFPLDTVSSPCLDVVG